MCGANANKRGLAPDNSRLPTDVSIRLGGDRVCLARTTWTLFSPSDETCGNHALSHSR